MQFSKSTAIELVALNQLAYTLANTGHCDLPAGFDCMISLRMPKTGRPFLLRNDPLDIWGFAATKGDVLYLVFRGTQFTSGIDFWQEWGEDALCLPLEHCGAGGVHCGFYGAWTAMRDTVAKIIANSGCRTRVVTGHSLGAAIATLCWAELGGDLMTFASPRVGDKEFANALWHGQMVRVINSPDIVPAVPLDPPFRHGGTEITVYGHGSMLDRKTAHSLPAYIAGIQLYQEVTA